MKKFCAICQSKYRLKEVGKNSKYRIYMCDECQKQPEPSGYLKAKERLRKKGYKI